MQFGRSSEMGEGLTGWLSPQGEFFPCEYGEHSYLASEIFDTHENSNQMKRERINISNEKRGILPHDETLKEMLWIPMGTPKWGSNPSKDYLFIPFTGRTEPQIKWFEDNYDKLSETQQEMLKEHIEDYILLNEE
jgi:hypothetical protein